MSSTVMVGRRCAVATGVRRSERANNRVVASGHLLALETCAHFAVVRCSSSPGHSPATVYEEARDLSIVEHRV